MILKGLFKNFLDIIAENYQFQTNLAQDWEAFQQTQLYSSRPQPEYNPTRSLAESIPSFNSGNSENRKRSSSDGDKFLEFSHFMASLPFPLKNTNNLPSYHTQSIYLKIDPKRALFMGLVFEFFKDTSLLLRDSSGEEESPEFKRVTAKFNSYNFQMTRNKQTILLKFLNDMKAYSREIREKETTDADIYLFLMKILKSDCLLEEALIEMMKEVVVEFIVTIDESQRKMVVENDMELSDLILGIRSFGFDTSGASGNNNKVLNKIKWLAACAFNLSIEFHEIGKDSTSSEIFSNSLLKNPISKKKRALHFLSIKLTNEVFVLAPRIVSEASAPSLPAAVTEHSIINNGLVQNERRHFSSYENLLTPEQMQNQKVQETWNKALLKKQVGNLLSFLNDNNQEYDSLAFKPVSEYSKKPIPKKPVQQINRVYPKENNENILNPNADVSRGMRGRTKERATSVQPRLGIYAAPSVIEPHQYLPIQPGLGGIPGEVRGNIFQMGMAGYAQNFTTDRIKLY